MHSGHASLLSFQIQQEQTVFIWQKVRKAAASQNTEEEHSCILWLQFVCTLNLKLSTENQTESSTKMVFHISKSRSDIQQDSGGRAYSRGLHSLPQRPPPGAKLTSQGDAHMGTNAQINSCINHWLYTFGLAVLTSPSRLPFLTVSSQL